MHKNYMDIEYDLLKNLKRIGSVPDQIYSIKCQDEFYAKFGIEYEHLMYSIYYHKL